MYKQTDNPSLTQAYLHNFELFVSLYIHFHLWGQSLWITNISLVHGDLISCVASLVHYIFKTIHILVTNS